MSDKDYLWDRSGDPDPEVERLEALLRPLRSTRPLPALEPARSPRRLWSAGPSLTLAAAAAVIVALAAAWQAQPGPTPSWELAWPEGPSSAAPHVVQRARLGVGEWVETGGAGRVRIRVGAIGEVELEPRTRIGLLDAGRRWHRLSLARGVMHARIWAPPGQFLVDTPSAVVVDMGCRYTLEVGGDGSGLLRVETGWVGFEQRGRDSFVPAGALCATRTGAGPGTPYWADAGATLQHALTEVDFSPSPERRREALHRVLAEARARDALSLWHLLARVDDDERARVYDRLAALVPPPAGVRREAILRADRAALDAWWERLGLGSAGFWRQWTAPWASEANTRR